jgi:hypothetical protein
MGVIVGHNECLNNLTKKYGDKIFDENGMLEDEVSKNVTIYRAKRNGIRKGE